MPDFEGSPEHVWTLTEIWSRADKELKQVKRMFGDAQEKTACAVGAIAYYASGGKTCTPNPTGKDESYNLWAMADQAFLRAGFGDVTDLNDHESWTFKMFRDKAAELGI